jgi:hypothetical protein
VWPAWSHTFGLLEFPSWFPHDLNDLCENYVRIQPWMANKQEIKLGIHIGLGRYSVFDLNQWRLYIFSHYVLVINKYHSQWYCNIVKLQRMPLVNMYT